MVAPYHSLRVYPQLRKPRSLAFAPTLDLWIRWRTFSLGLLHIVGFVKGGGDSPLMFPKVPQSSRLESLGFPSYRKTSQNDLNNRLITKWKTIDPPAWVRKNTMQEPEQKHVLFCISSYLFIFWAISFKFQKRETKVQFQPFKPAPPWVAPAYPSMGGRTCTRCRQHEL